MAITVLPLALTALPERAFRAAIARDQPATARVTMLQLLDGQGLSHHIDGVRVELDDARKFDVALVEAD